MPAINTVFSEDITTLGTIGRQGEQDTRQIAFDCREVLSACPGASIVCAYKRPCDMTPYLHALTASAGVYTMTLSDTDLYAPGFCAIEIRVLQGDKVLKSGIYIALIADSLRGEADEPPSPTHDALNRLSQTLDQAIAATEDAKAIAQRAEQAAKKAEEAADAAGSIVAGTLPVATSERLGGVKIGDNMSITEDGTLSATGVAFETDETLSLDNGVLSVNRAENVEQDNTLPITSAAVYTTVGNINALLGTI